MPPVLAALLALGLLGLVVVRSTPAPGRVLAALALCALAVAAFDPPAAVAREVPAEVVVLATSGSAGPELAPLLERAQAKGAVVRAAPGRGTFPERLLASALRAGPRPGEVLAVWNGPAAETAPTGLHAAAATAVTPLPFDPASLKVTANGPLFAGRPALLEVSSPAPQKLPAELVLRDAKGAEVLRNTIELPPGGAATVRWLPAAAGPLALELRVRVDQDEVVRRGTVAVREPLPVLVMDHTGVATAALRAQGIAVQEVAALPQDLAPFAAAVLLEPLPPSEQQRVAEAEAEGLGLLVGGPAVLSEAFVPLLPVKLLPGVVSKGDHPSAGNEAGSGQAAPGTDPRAEPTKPPDAGPPPQPSPPGKPPAGSTEGAKPSDKPLQEVERRSVAMVLVVDRSASMGEIIDMHNNKMSYAKTSALQTAKALEEGDMVGIVTFGNQGKGRIELPLTPAADTKTVEQGVRHLAHAREETYLLSGLERAHDMLKGKRFPVRHIVVISDGDIVLDEELALKSLARRLKSEGMTLSIVQIGGTTTSGFQAKAAQEIAETGGGRRIEGEAASVPVFVSNEVVSALDRVGRRPANANGPGAGTDPGAGKPPDKPPDKSADLSKPPEQPKPPAPPVPAPPTEPQEIPVRAVAESELLQPLPAAWPGLRASMPCKATPDALVLLVAGQQGHPLLAFANRGLGRVAAFTADLVAADCAAFRAEPGFPARFSQWLQAVRRPDAATAPADLLQPGFQLQPLRPTPADVAALAAATGAPVQSIDAWQPPLPRLEVAREGQAPAWALPASLLLVLLVAGEWALLRLRPHG